MTNMTAAPAPLALTTTVLGQLMHEMVGQHFANPHLDEVLAALTGVGSALHTGSPRTAAARWTEARSLMVAVGIPTAAFDAVMG